MDAEIRPLVDGIAHRLTVDTRTTLLDAPRERLGVTSPKKGWTTGSAAPAPSCSTVSGRTAASRSRWRTRTRRSLPPPGCRTARSCTRCSTSWGSSIFERRVRCASVWTPSTGGGATRGARGHRRRAGEPGCRALLDVQLRRQFAEVRVNEDIGEVRVPRLLGVFDVGRIINPKTARSQLIGGMTQGLSMALHEHAVLDPGSGTWSITTSPGITSRPTPMSAPLKRTGCRERTRTPTRWGPRVSRDWHRRHGGRDRERRAPRHWHPGARPPGHPRQAPALSRECQSTGARAGPRFPGS